MACGAAITVALRIGPPPTQALTASPVVMAVLHDAGSPAVGNPAADVTIVVFTDYRCPICRGTDPALAAALHADPHLLVIYKDWPIFGEASRYAARVALAAQRQGLYGAAHDALMTTRRPLDRAAVRDVVTAAGVDWPRVEADLAANGDEIDAQLKRHAFQAWSLGIEGTPAYLIGPNLYRGGLGGPALRRAIVRAREASRPAGWPRPRASPSTAREM